MPSDLDVRQGDQYVRVVLGAEDLPLLARQASGGPVEKALLVASLTTQVLGARTSVPIEFVVDPNAQTTSTGGATVHLHQHVGGVPVFQTSQVVQFGPRGDTRRSQATVVAPSDVPPLAPRVTPLEAVGVAARHVTSADPGPGRSGVDGEPDLRVTVETSDLELLAEFPLLAARPCVFAAGSFAEPVEASLVWFPMGGGLRLSWQVDVAVSPALGAYTTVVAADDGALLYSRQLVLGAIQGHVYRLDPGRDREVTPFPRPWSEYDLPIDPAVPDPPPAWVADTAAIETRGYCADTVTDAGARRAVARAGVFDSREPHGTDQQLVNAFYGACLMHDVAYLLGFREDAGNYQEGAASTGRPHGRVRVEVCATQILGTAHWWPLGSTPKLRLGPRPDSGRHSALDMTLVVHEYMHGVTTRLVGGGRQPNPLTQPQSRGMGEGWGDYVACTLTGARVIGAWVTADDRGMRRFPYDAAFPVEHASFGILDTLGAYEIGEMWCMTLLRMTARIGRALGLQLVFDGLTSLPVNPSLLDGRDAILVALDDRLEAGLLSTQEHAAAKAGVWTSFAEFGMGVGAHCVGSGTTGAVADSSVP